MSKTRPFSSSIASKYTYSFSTQILVVWDTWGHWVKNKFADKRFCTKVPENDKQKTVQRLLWGHKSSWMAIHRKVIMRIKKHDMSQKYAEERFLEARGECFGFWLLSEVFLFRAIFCFPIWRHTRIAQPLWTYMIPRWNKIGTLNLFRNFILGDSAR